ncbi:MAG: hypothetical protein ACLFPX_01510 [Candidatus Omnitrophota bacterium]
MSLFNLSKDDHQDIKDRIIQFDSSTAMVNALARHLQEKDFPLVGMGDDLPAWVGEAFNTVPSKIRKMLYSWSGWVDAIPAKGLAEIQGEEISRWITDLYSAQQYPGIMFGSSNGAVIHICAALGMPWLPQTFLVASRRFIDPDEILKDIEWGAGAITPFLKNNPDMQANQMHDPIQDRLMIQKMGYFRIKRRALGETYQSFIRDRLADDAPLISVECRYAWPQLQVSDRHRFQLGGLGAVDPYEYLEGSDRVRAFLKKVGAKADHWKTFQPTDEYPESEWGYVPEAVEDMKRFASENGVPLTRLVFDEPEDISRFTADLYEWWYAQRGVQWKSLLVENFGLLAPFDTVKASAIPFWLAFNTMDSYHRICKYLSEHEKFVNIYLMLMSNGMAEGIGLTPIEEWHKILDQAERDGQFIGVNEREYPLDFGTFIKYNHDLKKKIPQHDGLPDPLSWDEFLEFAASREGRYPVEIRQEDAA